MARRAGYTTTVAELIETPDEPILGELISHAAESRIGTHAHDQTDAWLEELAVLRIAFAQVLAAVPRARDWPVILEFDIPRRSGRIDCVVLAHQLIFVLEFKSGRIDRAAERQVEDYALELADFHSGSRGHAIIPVVCAGQADQEAVGAAQQNTRVYEVSRTSYQGLGAVLRTLVRRASGEFGPMLDADWVMAMYQPTPTIIEAAKALYSGHEVGDITHSAASAKQLEDTNAAVAEIVEHSRRQQKRAICFITGIPGAGKTLAGLNVAHSLERGQGTFLSGNGPLVRVLREALARDEASRTGESRRDCRRRSSTFITNIHKWLDEYIDRSSADVPNEHVIVFDEAQRAWSREHSRRKFKRDASEPSMILGVMSRQSDWAVIVALVGGGQEINVGEAGLGEWGRSLTTEFTDWSVVVTPELATGSTDLAGGALFQTMPESVQQRVRQDPRLHLRTSQRSYRTLRLTKWVEAVLAGESDLAAQDAPDPGEFPIHLTRDLDQMRDWLRSRARGLRRRGLVASSGARRLRVHGIDVKADFDPIDWFLGDHDDVRSSDYLEIAATEFGIQGLELDWIGVAWGADLRWTDGRWCFHQFRGTKWQAINDDTRKQYLLNKYRVLLTRAREGIVIWVPPGDSRDPTRAPRLYDRTFAYLHRCVSRSGAGSTGAT